MIEYFRFNFGIKCLGEITWAHAVNNTEKFERYLNSRDAMFIESDILLAKDGTPIAAHPPASESNLVLADLLAGMKTSRQGLKLDFKDPKAVEPSLDLLKQAGLAQPVLLNADILKGPGGKSSKFEANEFIDRCLSFYSQGILSLGWTTTNNADGEYSKADVSEMLRLCEGLEEVTFPIRACLLISSWQNLQSLISKASYSLTIWNNERVNPELMEWIKKHTDPEKTMYDLIDADRNPLRLR